MALVPNGTLAVDSQDFFSADWTYERELLEDSICPWLQMLQGPFPFNLGTIQRWSFGWTQCWQKINMESNRNTSNYNKSHLQKWLYNLIKIDYPNVGFFKRRGSEFNRTSNILHEYKHIFVHKSPGQLHISIRLLAYTISPLLACSTSYYPSQGGKDTFC